ncbi:MAG: type II toxin-antitoxin system RelE/ParE family toxin [Snowella sp.]|nr:type II toxin-antitoxin system RelE/ParE family toxin [Snowella sp.]
MANKMQNSWKVLSHKAFEQEFDELPLLVKQGLAARVALLKQFGPTLGRPYVDTLKGSRFDNMKEIRFNANDGVWRVAFAFDPS